MVIIPIEIGGIGKEEQEENEEEREMRTADRCRSVPVQMGPTAPKSDPSAAFRFFFFSWFIFDSSVAVRLALIFDFQFLFRKCSKVSILRFSDADAVVVHFGHYAAIVCNMASWFQLNELMNRWIIHWFLNGTVGGMDARDVVEMRVGYSIKN